MCGMINPLGSVKDRIGYATIKDGEGRGLIEVAEKIKLTFSATSF